MYGTIFPMKVKPGQEEAAISLMKEWEKERKPKVGGAAGGYVMKPDNKQGLLIGVAVFKDKASYMANADGTSSKRIPSGKTGSTSWTCQVNTS